MTSESAASVYRTAGDVLFTGKFAAVPGDYTRSVVGGQMPGRHAYTRVDTVTEVRTFESSTCPADPLLLYFTSGITSRPNSSSTARSPIRSADRGGDDLRPQLPQVRHARVAGPDPARWCHHILCVTGRIADANQGQSLGWPGSLREAVSAGERSCAGSARCPQQ